MTSLRVLIAGGSADDKALALAELRREWPAAILEEPELLLEDDSSGARPDLLLIVSDLALDHSVTILRGARERWPDLPVVMLAGPALEEAAVEAVQSGFDGHVPRQRIARLVEAAQAAIRHREEVVRARQAAARLLQVQKLEAAGRLAAGIAHDFNNLLGIIDGYASLIAESTPEADERHRYAGEILRASRRGAELTTRLLAFGPQQVPAARDVDLRDVVGDLVRALQLLVPEDVVLVVELGEEPAIVHADAGRLGQAIVNVVANAVDAIAGDGRIVVRLETDESEVRLEVEDTGSGIEVHELPHVFDPFFTTRGQGRGHGLSTAYGTVRQADGRIELDSTVGEGTTVTIGLPLVTNPTPEGQAAVQLGDGTTTIARPGEAVLVVEDSDELRQLLHAVLEAAGFTVRGAENGERALESIRAHGAPAVVVADVEMPAMGGLELARRLEELHPDVRVLLVSGYAPGETLAELGARDFLPKPFTPGELTSRLRDLLDR